MNRTVPSDTEIFSKLFSEVCAKCFGHLSKSVLPESECKQLSFKIEECTGFVIGWKSLKNYSFALWDKQSTLNANPSSATLDTLARYVLNIPASNELSRKQNSDPYQYWFQYRENCLNGISKHKSKATLFRYASFFLLALIIIGSYLIILRNKKPLDIEERFQSVDNKTLQKNGWRVFDKDSEFWQKRDNTDNCLTLFTLNGDSWPNEVYPQKVKNVLYRKVQADNFSVEIHFYDFVPSENWQQAGIFLLEDTLFSQKYLRMTLAYNDKLGDAEKSKKILAHVVASEGDESLNVEEVVVHPLFSFNNSTKEQIEEQFRYSAIKIEKNGNNYRFLSAYEPYSNFSYREIGTYQFDMDINYIGIFAIKGYFVDTTDIIPVKINYFKLKSLDSH